MRISSLDYTERPDGVIGEADGRLDGSAVQSRFELSETRFARLAYPTLLRSVELAEAVERAAARSLRLVCSNLREESSPSREVESDAVALDELLRENDVLTEVTRAKRV